MMRALDQGWECPLPDDAGAARVTLAHGEGGRLARRLIRELIAPCLGPAGRVNYDDAALLPGRLERPVITTDSFVVAPLFFPGGDIGSLAVYGTVNDLAVRGARPGWITLALILEEGFRLDTLERVLRSVGQAASQVGVEIIAGDTKVVPRGAADGLFINTTGLGDLLPAAPVGAAQLVPGDCLLVSGPIGRHGVAVLAQREGLAFAPPIASDCAPLVDAVAALRAAGIVPRALRDATRGGVAAVLHEWAAESGHSLTVDEAALPIDPQVRGASELLGLDPLHIANEGTMVVAVAADIAAAARQALRTIPVSAQAEIVGQVRPRGAAAVTVRRSLGREQPLDDPLGAPLPRIC